MKLVRGWGHLSYCFDRNFGCPTFFILTPLNLDVFASLAVFYLSSFALQYLSSAAKLINFTLNLYMFLVDTSWSLIDLGFTTSFKDNVPVYTTTILVSLDVVVIIIRLLFVDQTRAYFTQLRQELGQRILDKVYDPNTNKPSKVCV